MWHGHRRRAKENDHDYIPPALPRPPGWVNVPVALPFLSPQRFSCFSMQNPIVRNCHNCLTNFVFHNFCFPFCPFCFPKKFFPTIGKNFSNHWKTRPSPPSYQIVQNPRGLASASLPCPTRRSRPRSGFLPFPVASPPASLSMSAQRFSCFSM